MPLKYWVFVVANLLLLLLLCYLSWHIPLFTWPAIGLGISQLVSLAAYLVCGDRPLLEKAKWSYQLLTAQWLCVLLPNQSNFEWPLLVCTIADQLIVLAAAMLGVWLAKIFTGRRLVAQASTNQRNVPSLRLLDLVVFTFFVAMVVWLIGQSEPVQREDVWSGFGYNLVILLAIYFGFPAGFLLPLILIGTMMDTRYYSSRWIAGWIAIVALNTTMVFTLPDYYGNVSGLQIFATALAVPALAIAMFFRKQGVRFAKCPKQPMHEARSADQTF